MTRRVRSAENCKHYCRQQPDRFIVQPRSEEIENCRHGDRVGNCEQPNRQYVSSKDPEQNPVNQREPRRLVKIDLAIERLSSNELFSSGKPETIVLVQMSCIENSQRDADSRDYSKPGEKPSPCNRVGLVGHSISMISESCVGHQEWIET